MRAPKAVEASEVPTRRIGETPSQRALFQSLALRIVFVRSATSSACPPALHPILMRELNDAHCEIIMDAA
jgi:hypothetical protein